MTFYELTRFAKGRARDDWERTAQICALIHNVNRRAGTRPVKAEQYNPFSDTNKKTASKPIDQLFADFGPVIDFKG